MRDDTKHESLGPTRGPLNHPPTHHREVHVMTRSDALSIVANPLVKSPDRLWAAAVCLLHTDAVTYHNAIKDLVWRAKQARHRIDDCQWFRWRD